MTWLSGFKVIDVVCKDRRLQDGDVGLFINPADRLLATVSFTDMELSVDPTHRSTKARWLCCV